MFPLSPLEWKIVILLGVVFGALLVSLLEMAQGGAKAEDQLAWQIILHNGAEEPVQPLH